MALTDVGMGVITATINATAVYAEGSCGVEGDISAGKPIGWSAPVDAVLVNRQYTASVTTNEVNATLIADVWGDTAATLGAATASLATTSISFVFPGGTFALALCYADLSSQVSSAEGDVESMTASFKGLSTTGAAAQGSWT